MEHLNFEWNPNSFSILGIEFTIDLRNITDININKKLTGMRKDLNNWSKRDLTPFGKTTVIKSLILSQIVHILSSLPSPSRYIIKEIENMLYTFLWDGKPDKIKRTTSKRKLIHGGLGMTDVKTFDKALKLSWIRRLYRSEAKWKDYIIHHCPRLPEMINLGYNFAIQL